MKSEFCEYVLDGIPITWQDLVKEAFHYAKIETRPELWESCEQFQRETLRVLAKSIDLLNFLGYKVEKNPEFKQIS